MKNRSVVQVCGTISLVYGGDQFHLVSSQLITDMYIYSYGYVKLTIMFPSTNMLPFFLAFFLSPYPIVSRLTLYSHA